jgi:hypothetical protein
MAPERVCCCCGQSFSVRTQNPTQTYCSSRSCQRARRRAWQQAKRAEDPDYRENEARVQKAWRETHPDFWRDWRKGNPDYVERNRVAQRQRDRRRRGGVDASVLANGDASAAADIVVSAGIYAIVPWSDACKWGRVTRANLFILRPVLVPARCGLLAKEDV